MVELTATEIEDGILGISEMEPEQFNGMKDMITELIALGYTREEIINAVVQVVAYFIDNYCVE